MAKTSGTRTPRVSADRERIEAVLNQLHGHGEIDLAKPLRDAIPYLEKTMGAAQNVYEDDWWWVLFGKWGNLPGVLFGIGSSF